MSFTVFAAPGAAGDIIHVAFVADKATIAPGEDVTISAYITANGTADVSFDTSVMVGMVFDTNNFAYEVIESGTFEVQDLIEDDTYIADLWFADYETMSYAAATPCIQVKFTADADAAEGSYSFDVSEDALDTSFLHDIYVWDTDTGNVSLTGTTVEVKAAAEEPEEEVFGITSTGSALAGTDTMKDENGENVAAAGDKVVAIFSKNVSDAELAAGSYGIIFGGVRYAGQAAVPAKTAWAIKLVGSAEQLPAGNYSYGVFAGDEVVNADSAWVIE